MATIGMGYERAAINLSFSVTSFSEIGDSSGVGVSSGVGASAFMRLSPYLDIHS